MSLVGSESTPKLECVESAMSFKCNATYRQHIYNLHTTLATIDFHGSKYSSTNNVLKLTYFSCVAMITLEMSFEKKKFSCPFCSILSKGYKTLQNHFTQVHPTLARPVKQNEPLQENFTFEEGSANVLRESDPIKRQKCGGIAKYYDLVPAQLLLSRKSTANSPRNTLHLPIFTNISFQQAFDELFSNSNTHQFDASLVFSSTENNEHFPSTHSTTSTAINLSNLNYNIQRSRFPRVASLIGPYEEMTLDLENALNCDMTNRKYLLNLIPDLYVGSIIQTVKSDG